MNAKFKIKNDFFLQKKKNENNFKNKNNRHKFLDRILKMKKKNTKKIFVKEGSQQLNMRIEQQLIEMYRFMYLV